MIIIINDIKEKLENISQLIEENEKQEISKDLNKILKNKSRNSIINELRREVVLLLNKLTELVYVAVVKKNKTSGVKYIYIPKKIPIKDGDLCLIKKIKGVSNEQDVIQDIEKSKLQNKNNTM